MRVSQRDFRGEEERALILVPSPFNGSEHSLYPENGVAQSFRALHLQALCPSKSGLKKRKVVFGQRI